MSRRRQGPRFIRKDANHSEIVIGLREYPGISVFETHDTGGGFGDIVVGFQRMNYIIEIKPPGMREYLTENEKQLHQRWHGQIDVAETIEEVLTIINYPMEVVR